MDSTFGMLLFRFPPATTMPHMPSFLANTAVPGPLSLFGAANTSLGLTWVVLAMVVCVSIEGFIYHRFRTFPRPYRLGLEANVVSAVLGIPATLLGLIFTGALDDILFTPTILTIIIELLYLMWRAGPSIPRKRLVVAVTGANVLSNAVLFGMLMAAFAMFPTGVQEKLKCGANVSNLNTVKRMWLQDHGNAPTLDPQKDLLPYFKDGKLPTCPKGGIYLNLSDPHREVTCSVHH